MFNDNECGKTEATPSEAACTKVLKDFRDFVARAWFPGNIKMLALFLTVFLFPLGAEPVSSPKTIILQVSDCRDHPIPGVILSAKGARDSISRPTDAAGKTEIIVSKKIQPGGRLFLILLSTPSKELQFLAPWEGRAVVPQPSDVVEVVLGKIGDPDALNNPKVLSSLAEAVNSRSGKLTDSGQVGSYKKSLRALTKIAEGLKLAPLLVDQAIRGWASSTRDPERRNTGTEYLKHLPQTAVDTLRKGT